jgi:hypothetical protein
MYLKGWIKRNPAHDGKPKREDEQDVKFIEFRISKPRERQFHLVGTFRGYILKDSSETAAGD